MSDDELPRQTRNHWLDRNYTTYVEEPLSGMPPLSSSPTPQDEPSHQDKLVNPGVGMSYTDYLTAPGRGTGPGPERGFIVNEPKPLPPQEALPYYRGPGGRILQALGMTTPVSPLSEHMAKELYPGINLTDSEKRQLGSMAVDSRFIQQGQQEGIKRQELAQKLAEHQQKQKEHQWSQITAVLGNDKLTDPQQEEILKGMAKTGHPIAAEMVGVVDAKMIGDYKLVQDRLGMPLEEIEQKLQRKEMTWHDLAAKVNVQKKNYIAELDSMAHEEAEQKSIQDIIDQYDKDPSKVPVTKKMKLKEYYTKHNKLDEELQALHHSNRKAPVDLANAQADLAYKQVAPHEAASYPVAGGKQATEIYRPETQSMERIVGDKPPANQIIMKQEGAFEAELGKENVKGIKATQVKAQDSASIIQNIHEGRRLLDSGMITGVGAEYLTTFGQALQQIGFSKDRDAIKNTQAYGSLMASNVAKHIKEFGAGTGLSDADREYAKKMAGGDVTLDEKSIREILRINEEMSRHMIRTHNKSVKGIKSMIPLTVEEPPQYESLKKSGKSSKGIPRITSDSDFDNLPSGTVFIGPDGKKRTKP